MGDRLARLSWRAKGLAPRPVKGVLRRIAEVADPLAVAAYRRRTGERGPIPPRELRAGVGAPWIADYLSSGKRTAADLDAALGQVGAKLSDFESVLDFGCGCGRVLQHLPLRSGTSFHGSDVNAPAIEWARDHIAGARLEVNGPLPPLPFDDDAFDLVYAVSVFTHLDEGPQFAWLEELARVTRPGALLLLSIHAAAAKARDWTGGLGSFGARVNDALADPSTPFVFVPFEDAAYAPGMGREARKSYGLTFHSLDYVRERWDGQLSVVDALPAAVNGFHDLVVARRRPLPPG